MHEVLSSIKKIKGLGVFGDFTAPADLPKMKRVNVIYGDNGSGKTTLSNLFTALVEGSHPEHADLDYLVATDAGDLFSGQKCSRGIRVFNSDYVQANIGRFDGPIRPILIVGQENKELAEEIRQDLSVIDRRESEIRSETDAIAKLNQEKDRAFSAIARTIGEATSGTTLRNFRKPDAEKAFARLTAPQSIDASTLDGHRATLQQQQEDAIPIMAAPQIWVGDSLEPKPIDEAAVAFQTVVHELARRTAQSAAIERLTAHPDIAVWAEAGLHIHREHGSASCEFCSQPLPVERMNALAEHFSVEDQRLKGDIEHAQAAGDALARLIEGIALPARTAFYSEIRDEWAREEAAFQTARREVLERIAALRSLLTSKLTERTVVLAPAGVIDTSELLAAIERMVALIARHNAKATDFEKEKAAARNAIETHYLSSIFNQIGDLTNGIKAQGIIIEGLTAGSDAIGDTRSLDEIRVAIAGKKAKISSAHAGSAELSGKIATFLGRTDLAFEPDEEGYRVLRRGKPAKRLSEGEKSAIAFIYFIVHLHDNDFDLPEGIIVIDDPVSSLDSSAIYQAFAFLKNAVKDARQVVLLTHNFDFLKLLLNWLHRRNDKSLYMLVCAETETGRASRIGRLDSLLEKHPTEYHFLFKTLYTFKSDGTIQSCYHVPNIARKLLETFLEFHVPSNLPPYEQLGAITFDEDKKAAIFKFTNDLSHRTGKGFDPAIVAETQKNVAYLLELIEAVAPKHFDGLKQLSGD